MKTITRQNITAKTRQFALINQFAPRIVKKLGYGKTSAVAWANNKAVCFEYQASDSPEQVKAALLAKAGAA